MLHLLGERTSAAGRRDAGPGPLDPALLSEPVLIVEDDAMVAWTMESMLEELGFTRIAIAPTGEAAIAHALRTPPRLVVSDIDLGPGAMDGIAAAAVIVAGTAASVVFVSGHADDAARRRDIAETVPGAVAIGKPAGSADVLDAILRATATAQ